MDSSGPKSGARSVVEGLKGKVKEATGALTDDDRLKAEGQAQQKKAEAEKDVAVKRGGSRTGPGQGAGSRGGAACPPALSLPMVADG